jgi:hypothetical protein
MVYLHSITDHKYSVKASLWGGLLLQTAYVACWPGAGHLFVPMSSRDPYTDQVRHKWMRRTIPKSQICTSKIYHAPLKKRCIQYINRIEWRATHPTSRLSVYHLTVSAQCSWRTRSGSKSGFRTGLMGVSIGYFSPHLFPWYVQKKMNKMQRHRDIIVPPYHPHASNTLINYEHHGPILLSPFHSQYASMIRLIRKRSNGGLLFDGYPSISPHVYIYEEKETPPNIFTSGPLSCHL